MQKIKHFTGMVDKNIIPCRKIGDLQFVITKIPGVPLSFFKFQLAKK